MAARRRDGKTGGGDHGALGRRRHAHVPERGGPIRLMWFETPVGSMVAGATDRGLCLLDWKSAGQMPPPPKGLPFDMVPGNHRHLKAVAKELAGFFSGGKKDFSTPLHLAGTPFQEKVWKALTEIPRGKTWSYADLAAAVGNPRAFRAVARANGQNPVPILVPCHRVIGKDGGIGGYSGGVWRKEKLLEIEGARGLGTSRK